MNENKGGTVVAINRATTAALELPEGFKEVEWLGVKRCSGEQAPRLVRLGDLVRWLEGDQLRSRAEALAMLIEALKPEHLPHLADLDRGQQRARPLTAADAFGFRTQQDLDAQRDRDIREATNAAWEASRGGTPKRWRDGGSDIARQLGARRALASGAPAAVAVEPGLPALLKRLHSDWVGKFPRKGAPDLLDDPRVRSANLAVSLPLAYELWDFGVPAHAPAAPVVELVPQRKPGEPLTWDELKAARPKQDEGSPPLEWTPEQVKRGQMEKAARVEANGGSARGVIKSMATELDISDAALNLQLKKGVQLSIATGRWEWVQPGKRQTETNRRGRVR
ncbi:MAG: hypothetical protein RI907_4013 [Pseudomonadota bacterium]|jgi:hypothetical protein